ncbi:hypothetical protein Tco_0172675 [Tanacetum coccineum]
MLLWRQNEKGQANARRQGNNGGWCQGGAPAARECTFSGFMKCNPMVFHGHEGAVELIRWFEKTEMVFGISECAEARKRNFAPLRKCSEWEHDLWNLKVKEFDITALHQAYS